jgi:hypothetical protein
MTNPDAAQRGVPTKVAAFTPIASSSQSQELIVLTAWEEIRTSAPRSFKTTAREVADFDTGTPEQTGVATQPNATGSTQITFTRLILLVVPADAATGSSVGAGSGSKPAHETTSRSHRPAASPLDGGWLFFQL